MDALMNYLGVSPTTEYFFAICTVFAGVVFFLGGLYFSFIKPQGEKQAMIDRWRFSPQKQGQAHLLKREGESDRSPLLALVKRFTGWQNLDFLQHSLYKGDLFCPPEVFLGVAGILACVGYLLGALCAPGYFQLVLALSLGSGPFLYLRIKQHLKTTRLEKQMPEGMEFLARSLRAGHTLQSSMELASTEIGHPLGEEFRIAFEEQRYGLGMRKALERMADRVDSQDLRFLVTAIVIQSETGGNLVEILENIGRLIRARLTLKGKISGLTAEGRFSALILGLLPIGIFIILYFMNRNYVMMLFLDPLGHKLMMAGVISLIFGVLWMKKMIRIRV
jgi:tight adherence protein B